jgi:hypothetical protein
MNDEPTPRRAGDDAGREPRTPYSAASSDLHPAHLNERELALDLVGSMLAPKCETYEVAIRSLVADGLLRRDGDSIHPTSAPVQTSPLRARLHISISPPSTEERIISFREDPWW